ncbi:sensor histidine kinase [Thioalkalivibrio thiocyanodenitrificans]|uniref:sensor histidine kinase n=1 Tax=Thioalkalivibrio thiocyanodenitrificans TaxID=243063 RepID=UPI00037F877E|nr:PAS domain S-box protein [Thioalkalivibrio thiocyanodenitrificans]
MRQWQIESKVLAGFALSVAVLAVVGAGLYRTTVGFIDTSDAVARSQKALTTLEAVYSLMNQAESHQRIYLLLGLPEYLELRHEAMARMHAQVTGLRELLGDDADLSAHLDELERRIDVRMALLDHVLEVRRTRGFQAGQRQLAASPGREEMHRVSEHVVFMQGELSARLQQRQQAAQAGAHSTLTMLGLLLVLVAASLTALHLQIRRESSERRDSEERLRAVVDTAADGIVTIDTQGRIESFNRAAERLFGYPAAEVIGGNVSRLMPEPECSRHDGYLRRYLDTGEARIIGSGREVTALRKDGSTIPISLAVSEVRLGARRLFTGILHDLTERKRAEQRQARLIGELHDANEELRNFAYVVSHDLKAPLRGVGSLADWLASDYAERLDDQGREYLDLMKSRVTRMDALIDGILEYSRVGRVHEMRTDVDLDALAAEVVHLLAPPAGVQVTVEGPLPSVIGERVRLQQVFQNLIGNALKHLDKPEGSIRVACADDGDHWRFSVTDNGPGIEPRHQERIFQLFQVLTPRDRKESTGVGLALVRKIVELHGGRVWVESTPGEGATFFFTLSKSGPPDRAGAQHP